MSRQSNSLTVSIALPKCSLDSTQPISLSISTSTLQRDLFDLDPIDEKSSQNWILFYTHCIIPDFKKPTLRGTAIQKALSARAWLIRNRDKVTEIQLSNLGLTDVPKAYQLFTNLKVFNLSGNQLTTQLDLSKLTQLTHLNLSNNSFSSLPNLSALTQLTYLNLHNTKSKVSPDVSALTQLQYLDLSKNLLESPPDVSTRLEADRAISLQ